MSDNENSGIGGFGWFLAGLGFGALIGVLYAPKSGKETREEIAAKSLEARDKAVELYNQGLEQASQYEDPDFNSPEKASAFLGLKTGYSPYRRVAMAIVGDVLRVDGSIVTEHLAADAAAAGQLPEEYAHRYYLRYSQALDYWRSSQVTGNAYAGTIRRFLNDPRLSEFTPEEVSRAYQRVFGRDLKTDLEADRIAARLGHPVTYNDMRMALATQPDKE